MSTLTANDLHPTHPEARCASDVERDRRARLLEILRQLETIEDVVAELADEGAQQ